MDLNKLSRIEDSTSKLYPPEQVIENPPMWIKSSEDIELWSKAVDKVSHKGQADEKDKIDVITTLAVFKRMKSGKKEDSVTYQSGDRYAANEQGVKPEYFTIRGADDDLVSIEDPDGSIRDIDTVRFQKMLTKYSLDRED